MFEKLLSKVQYKIAAIVFTAVLLAAVTNTWYGLNSSTKLLIKGAKSELSNLVVVEGKQIETKIQSISTDLNFIQQVPATHGIFRALDNFGKDPADNGSTTDQWILRMEKTFRSFLEAKPGFHEVRLIDNYGIELTKAVRTSEGITSPSDRSDVSEEKFFIDTLKLKEGETHVSQLMLKRDEDGKIIKPYSASFHYTTPVFFNNEIRAIIDIDVSVESYFKAILMMQSQDQEGTDTFIIDKKGYFLMHPNKSLQWGAELKNKASHISNICTTKLSKFIVSGNQGLVDDSERFLAYVPIYPKASNKKLFWILVRSIPQAHALSGMSKIQNISIIILLISLAITIYVSILLIRRFISTPLVKTASILNQVAQRNLQQKVSVDSSDEVGQMADALNQAIEAMSQAISSISSHAQNLVTASEKQTSLSERVTERMYSVSAGTEEMKNSIGHVALSASEAASVAKQSVNMVKDINQKISTLDKSSAEISEVMKLIDKIAEQTNMLALNATIESARAGEAGKGFAVVASEVKSLANGTSEAIDGIQSKIGAIQQEIQDIVLYMNKVYEVILNIDDYQTSIAASVEEQAATSNEIARNVADAASNTNDIYQYAANDLLKMASQLKEVVQKFNF